MDTERAVSRSRTKAGYKTTSAVRENMRRCAFHSRTAMSPLPWGETHVRESFSEPAKPFTRRPFVCRALREMFEPAQP